ncbi:hypothetical protein QBC37DRAFT_38755 [Rhypophila decipiens]|uniref:Uncharacterized protein n=1 Tax=Rhypophila decipiens TaxID=261697 RepID=A0AAN6YH83_9PEZI|nr:hypothetical protein QBC37DRAFT_38755 [Rhypophila decipiens]
MLLFLHVSTIPVAILMAAYLIRRISAVCDYVIFTCLCSQWSRGFEFESLDCEFSINAEQVELLIFQFALGCL